MKTYEQWVVQIFLAVDHWIDVEAFDNPFDTKAGAQRCLINKLKANPKGEYRIVHKIISWEVVCC